MKFILASVVLLGVGVGLEVAGYPDYRNMALGIGLVCIWAGVFGAASGSMKRGL